MRANILRAKFLSFFKSKRHKIVESDFLVPKDDPTVLFTPAGMNQFKKEFLGLNSGFSRAATAQRCLRTDDLDKVGKTSGHHTFFEMLGNFSFGDYFKKEAISYAWEFLTEELKIDKDKLWVSVYRDDEEAYGIWKDLIKIPETKIIKLGDKENFWPSESKEKGPCGPCGPCSEIFFDQGSDIGCRKPDCSPACSCGRFLEVWNLVFTQYNRKDSKVLEPLPKKNIDTGMGLERLAAVMQGKQNNFETDLFQPLVKEILSSVKKHVPQEMELTFAISDHIRAIAFAIYDGVLPSNEARGYVVRKLIRKAILHLRTLGLRHPFLYKLVPLLAQVMKSYYPELDERKENIAEIILAEEKSFILVLDSSDVLFKEKFSELLHKADPEAAGQVAFQLYDTHGIPLELTREWLDKHGIQIQEEAFNKELLAQKTRSKLQSAMKGDVFGDKNLLLGIKETKFLGYKEYTTGARIIRIIKNDVQVKKISKGDEVTLILDRTVFYPESGGQIGDTGEIIEPVRKISPTDKVLSGGLKAKNIFEVLDTKKSDKLILHIGRVKEGSFKTSDFVLAKIDTERRLAIARNHTATHLLQAALRKVLGTHVKQQGSLVDQERFRFDFTHFKDIDKEQLDRIEKIVNAYIINNYGLSTKQMSLTEARKTGALAFFGERYEGKVRVVSVGDFSREFCGGTHLDSTGQIGLFKIVQEGSVASGVRRIEAVTGTGAYKVIKEDEGIIAQVSSALNTQPERVVLEINKKLSHIKELEKKLNSQKLDYLKGGLDNLIKEAQILKDIKVITKVIENLDMNLLRKNIDLIKENTTSAVIALGSESQGRAFLVLGITEDLCSKGMDASKMIRDVAEAIGGSGGGRKDFAQAGGSKPGNFQIAFDKLKEIISRLP